MKHFRLHTGNRLEILAEKLADAMKTPLRSPLDREIVIVQSRGMERWISMRIAKGLGVCANIHFQFPNQFVHECFRAVFPGTPELPEKSPHDSGVMAWKIMTLLPLCVQTYGSDFETIRNYLDGGNGGLKLFQLSERIADTFDQYLLYRPEMLFKWEKGGNPENENVWQAVLWRELSKEIGNEHRAALGRKLVLALERGSVNPGKLPERVSVFGVSSLPKFHIDILHALSEISEVNLFLMNPCREYWGDVLTGPEKRKIVRRAPETECLHISEGNRFLSSFGAMGRDFFDSIQEYPETEENEYFEEPKGKGLLFSLQSDILNMTDRLESEKIEIDVKDDSIRVHSCHGPMREIEVLHDRLLRMFEADRSLEPRDVLVMIPDIEKYSPYVQAVFDLPAGDRRRIPFTIADRSVRLEGRIIETFLSIIDLADSRFTASQVLSVLEPDAVRSRFDLAEDEVDLIRVWVRETRIRWGIDGENREKLGLPGFNENSWKAGLERLLLGYAMAGGEHRMFANVLPYDYVEGGNARVLGKFLEFTDRLFSFVRSLGCRLTPAEWSAKLADMIGLFFTPDEETEREIRVVRQAACDLRDTAELAEFNEKIDLKIVKYFLKRNFEKKGFGFGFITGGVTFCAMLPMRSIPFRVICLAGMNSGDYPRQSGTPGFDLIAKDPKRGDRSRRKDDRYLFLESILSAREKLCILYSGQSVRDNSPIPPAVPVGEILDYIEQGFKLPEENENGEKNNILEKHVVVRHPLQAFSPRYFRDEKDSKLFSYSGGNLKAAKRLVQSRRNPVPYISKGLSRPEEEWKTVDIGDLCVFFDNPARYLLTRRLGLYLGEAVGVLEEKETFETGALDKYRIRQYLTGKRLEGGNPGRYFKVKKAAGELPHGTVGECVFREISREVEGFVEIIRPFINKPPLAPFQLDLHISDFRVTGKIESVYPERLVRFRHAKVTPTDRLRTWIRHLALNRANRVENPPAGDYPTTSLIAGKDSVWEFPPVENAGEILESLLQRYWEGLLEPLRFFPKASWAYVSAILEKKKSARDAALTATNEWIGDFMPGEIEDPYYKQCFEWTDAIDSEFETVAMDVFGPLVGKQLKIDI